MGRYVIATNMDGVIFGNYFTKVFDDEEAAKRTLRHVRLYDPKARLLEVVEKGEEFNADKENS